MQNKIILNIGKKGSGKSHLTKEALTLGNPSRVIVFDFMREYHLNGYIYFEDVNLCLDYLSENCDKKYKVICNFDNRDEDYLKILSIASCLSGAWFIIDEFHFLCNESYTYQEVKDLIRVGRHWGVSLLGITQRIIGIPRIFSAMCDAIIMFRTTEINDLKYLEKTAFIGKDGAEKVSHLDQYQPILFINE